MPEITEVPAISDAVEKLISDWSLWMRAGNMSGRTIEERALLIRRLVVATGSDPLKCDWPPLAEFLASPGLSRGTRQVYHSTICVFFNWLLLMEFRTDNPAAKLRKPQQPRRRPRPITTAELERLLNSGIYSRTRMMVLLAAYQGLRVHEIARFRGDHIRGDLVRVVGKGGLDAILPLHPLIASDAALFPAVGYWFPSPATPGEPILAKSVSNVVSKAMARAGIHGTAHQLRHWHGTQTLKSSGGNLRTVQELLRHASVATTAGYCKVDESERRAALEALPSVEYTPPRRARRRPPAPTEPSTDLRQRA